MVLCRAVVPSWVLWLGLGLTGCIAAMPEDAYEQTESSVLGSRSSLSLARAASEVPLGGLKQAAATTKALPSTPTSAKLAAEAGIASSSIHAELGGALPGMLEVLPVPDESTPQFLVATTLNELCKVVGQCDLWLSRAVARDDFGQLRLAPDADAMLQRLIRELQTPALDDRATQAGALASQLVRLSQSPRAILQPLELAASPRAVLRESPAFAQPLEAQIRVSRAQQIARVKRDVELDLASASYIGLSRRGLDEVLEQLLGKSLSAFASPDLDAVAASALAPRKTGLSPAAPDYVLSLKGAMLEQWETAPTSMPACATSDPPLPQGVMLFSSGEGVATCAPGGTPLDSALDMQCYNYFPAPDKVYCSNEQNYEWGAATSQKHDMRGLPFAVAARRCEPCTLGLDSGTLSVVPVRGWWGTTTLIGCDTSDACDPDREGNLEVEGCNCLGLPES